MRFAIKSASSLGEQQLNGPALSTGQWYHVAITLTGDTGTMYLNGTPVATNTNMTASPSDLGFTTQNYLGHSQYAADPPLRGRIDDFRIYSEALPAEQILSMAGGSAASLLAAAEAPTTGLTTTTTANIELSPALLSSYSTADTIEQASPLSVATEPSTSESAMLAEARESTFALLADAPADGLEADRDDVSETEYPLANGDASSLSSAEADSDGLDDPMHDAFDDALEQDIWA